MTKRFFPWRVYKKIYLTHVGLLVLTLSLSALLMFWWGGHVVMNAGTFGFMFVVFVLGLMLSALASYQLTLPMAKVLVKTLRLASKKQDTLLAGLEEDLFDHEPGEYYELEKALDKIARKLKKRRIQLAHEREESQALMSSLADAVVSLDREEKIKFFNSQFASQFMDSNALKISQEHGELKMMDIVRDIDLLKAIRETLAMGEPRVLQRMISTKLNPMGRCFSLSIAPLKEEREPREVYGALVLLHDITDMKAADKMRAEFVENASHELRTPLTSIRGYVSMAREDADQKNFEAVPDFLRIISKSVDRLMELVNDLLTISSLENSSPLEFVSLDVRTVTEEVLETLSPLAADKNILMKAHFDAKAMRGNERLLEQVLTNLVGNSIKYMQDPALSSSPTKSGLRAQIDVCWDEVETEALTAAGAPLHWVRLRVKDNGPGIAEDSQGRLFERFYRVDKARSRDVGGTGLGLAIVKHVVLSHGGEISVKSKLGQGAEFICLFPAQPKLRTLPSP